MKKHPSNFTNTSSFEVNHYENFPVGSILLPRKHRQSIRQIYHFARTADDLADEGNFSEGERLTALETYRNSFKDHLDNAKNDFALFSLLKDTKEKYELPEYLFFDLLSAFKQDVTKKRYEDFPELLQYCERSANPIGRLLLHIFGFTTGQNLFLSDRICTSLQIINFLQDIHIDFLDKNRIYFPANEMRTFGIKEKHFEGRRIDAAWKSFIKFQIDRAKSMLAEGMPLSLEISGRFGLEMKIIIKAAEKVINKLEKTDGNIYEKRPTLTKVDWPFILISALLK